MREHPAVVAAERRGRLDRTLRFLREVLGVEDATDLIEATPQLASMPLAVLAARHAYLRRVGAPHGAQLATPGLRPPLLGDLYMTILRRNYANNLKAIAERLDDGVGNCLLTKVRVCRRASAGNGWPPAKLEEEVVADGQPRLSGAPARARAMYSIERPVPPLRCCLQDHAVDLVIGKESKRGDHSSAFSTFQPLPYCFSSAALIKFATYEYTLPWNEAWLKASVAISRQKSISSGRKAELASSGRPAGWTHRAGRGRR